MQSVHIPKCIHTPILLGLDVAGPTIAHGHSSTCMHHMVVLCSRHCPLTAVGQYFTSADMRAAVSLRWDTHVIPIQFVSCLSCCLKAQACVVWMKRRHSVRHSNDANLSCKLFPDRHQRKGENQTVSLCHDCMHQC